MSHRQTWFSILTLYSFQEPPSCGIMAALQPERPVGRLRFEKDESLKDENQWFAGLYDGNDELVAFSSIPYYYHEGHLADVDTFAPVYVDLDPVIVEQAYEFLVNNGEKPVWWREDDDA